uniref:Uncharacterized protein n=1 Tax=Human betaherpesvirus 6 TaxID=10368 RepID=A0A5P9VJK4_9BETA|nr:hypothetical protein [Human betaherpesvirus 6]QFV47790.1 hypothetical protein [Human betaherpesvirus 6]QFX16108.1 hypothetical protein [Human betaherpesvirus 6]QFX63840.1 hypothetical protein [Human betaherpesvirus 6]
MEPSTTPLNPKLQINQLAFLIHLLYHTEIKNST